MPTFSPSLDELSMTASRADPLGRNFAAVSPQQAPGGDMFNQAMNAYPILRKAYERGDLHFKFTPREGHTLETWPPGEHGFGPNNWRPPDFPINKHGVEVYSKDVPSIDILGDVVSHMLMKSDPILQQAYRDFESSLTPRQLRMLRNQFDWGIAHGDNPNRVSLNGDHSGYEAWKQDSGLPGLFRGYLFKQWQPLPGQLQATIDGQPIYTPGQIQMFNNLRKYLGIQPGTIPERAEGRLDSEEQ